MKLLNDGDTIAVTTSAPVEIPLTISVENTGGAPVTLDLIRSDGHSDLPAFSYNGTTVENIYLTAGVAYKITIPVGNVVHISNAGGLLNVIPSA